MGLKNIELKRNVELKRFTTIGIGGSGSCLFLVHTIDDLIHIMNDCGNSFYLLGAGSNLLIRDRVITTPIIKLGRDFRYAKGVMDSVEVGAATPVSELLNFCMKNNLSGLENLAGIPATMGGLLTNNASAFGRQISTLLEKVEVMNREGKVQLLKKNQITFGYRFSSLKDYVVIRAWFRLTRSNDLKRTTSLLFRERLHTQDFDHPSCGCIFKNPADNAAGLLIERCGLKGLKRADAQISVKHANFIINLGRATYNDVDS
ncbi:MAG: UDP-N-acetylmuramate dehydrogenase, partial [Candidatus Omnitrophota bacterium]